VCGDSSLSVGMLLLSVGTPSFSLWEHFLSARKLPVYGNTFCMWE
jgi:hypothetical protein